MSQVLDYSILHCKKTNENVFEQRDIKRESLKSKLTDCPKDCFNIYRQSKLPFSYCWDCDDCDRYISLTELWKNRK